MLGTRKVVLFNQWFSSIGSIIDDIKKNIGHRVIIIGTSKNPNHVYKNNVNIFVKEQWETDEEYIEFMLKTCKEYRVDIFICKKKAKLIMLNKERFDELGVKILYEDIDTIEKTEDKIQVYNKLKDTIPSIIPFYTHTDNKSEAIKLITDSDKKLCMKLSNDEGGFSFREIVDKEVNFNTLSGYWVNKLRKNEAIELIESLNEEELSKIMFMEMLDGPEISVDCYNSLNGFIAICRTKEGRCEKIFRDSTIENICYNIGKIYNFKNIFNVQFRFKPGSNGDITEQNLRLLEINTRVSGGMYLEVECGLNLLLYELYDIFEDTKEYNLEKFSDFKEKYVSHIEKAAILS